MNNQAAQTMPECTCRDNEGCTKPCDRKACQPVPLSEELLIEAAILSGNTPQEMRLQKVLKQAAAALAQTAGVPSWIVNDLGELGVMVNGVAYFLYKGDNIVYEDAKHDDGSPMLYRMVGKREFGETCWPRKWVEAGRREDRYTEELYYAPGLSDGKPEDGDWRPLPAQGAAPAASGGESHPGALQDGTLPKSTAKRVEALGASGGEDVPTFVELHNRFLSDTSQIPDEYQDWRAEFANDLLKRAVIEMTTQPSTPPPAASVSERARKLLEQSRNGRALRNDGLVEVGQAIDALEQALTQQQGCATCGGRGEIGGHVGQTAETFDYVTEPCPECTTPQPSADAVRELVRRWRTGAGLCARQDYGDGARDALNECANELESLLSGGLHA